MAIAASTHLSGPAPDAEATRLWLPYPEALPARRTDVTAGVRLLLPGSSSGVLAMFGEPAGRAELRKQLAAHPQEPGPCSPVRHGPAERPGGRFHERRPPGRQPQAEQQEHDRYFEVGRSVGDAARAFAAGLSLAHLAAYENSLTMGVTLLDDQEWRQLFGGLTLLTGIAGRDAARDDAGAGIAPLPARPEPAGWRDGYDPGRRWLVGHQLFFALIQGAVVGLNCFTRAAAGQATSEADEGLALAAAFLRSSAAAMKFASDFAPDDYEATVRPAMAPPRVREGFSGLQTRDHAYLVRVFGAVKPALAALDGQAGAHQEFVESVVAAYAAHEFICARFRGSVLPSLRMAAASRGKTGRTGTDVIRELMQARLALVSRP
jgi:hypothetical protein